MEPYSRVDFIFPKTMWMGGSGDMYIILLAIGTYLERALVSTPEYEYLFTCDLYCAGKPYASSIDLFCRAYSQVIPELYGREVLKASVVTKENCLILELLCNHRTNTISYPSTPL